MTDFFEIDFLDVETKKSGDAIPLRYHVNGITYIHVVDGGYRDCGELVVNHINKYYDRPALIDHVVVTHPDGDHAAGLKYVLENMPVGTLWMLRPWKFAREIIHRFATYESVEHLERRLRAIYANLAELEDIANSKGIPIEDPFQGALIGEFKVLAPSKSRYLDLVVESERTPESIEEERASVTTTLAEAITGVLTAAINLVRAAWGDEVFSTEETSNENEMSVIQYANIAGDKILLTGDAGRGALAEAADYAPLAALALPGIDRFQVPHHGSRRNVSTELLDRWLGSRLPEKPAPGEERFTAMISSAKADTHHPRKSVIRAMIHRGAKVITTEDGGKVMWKNQPYRDGWGGVTGVAYPEDQEE